MLPSPTREPSNGNTSLVSGSSTTAAPTLRMPLINDYTRLMRENLSYEQLRKMCIDGQLRTSSVRALVWMMLFKCIPVVKDEWVTVLHRSREVYSSLKLKHVTDPHMQDSISLDPSVVNPLSEHHQNPWKKFFEDGDLRDLINKDVCRTFPEIGLFQQCDIRGMLSDILLVYAKENAFVSYKQGMHEILAALLFVLYSDHQTYEHYKETGAIGNLSMNEQSIIATVYEEKFMEHDCFALFTEVMRDVSAWYEDCATPTSESQPFNVEMQPFLRMQDVKGTSRLMEELAAIGGHLQVVDPALHKHLSTLDIPPQLYGIRWLRLLFAREFPLHDLLYLWDVLFSQQPLSRFVQCMFVAMLMHIRQLLLECDYSGCLQYLMRYPPTVDVKEFLNLVLHLRYPTKYPRPQLATVTNYTKMTVAGTVHPNAARDAPIVLNKEVDRDGSINVRRQSPQSKPVLRPSTSLFGGRKKRNDPIASTSQEETNGRERRNEKIEELEMRCESMTEELREREATMVDCARRIKRISSELVAVNGENDEKRKEMAETLTKIAGALSLRLPPFERPTTSSTSSSREMNEFRIGASFNYMHDVDREWSESKGREERGGEDTDGVSRLRGIRLSRRSRRLVSASSTDSTDSHERHERKLDKKHPSSGAPAPNNSYFGSSRNSKPEPPVASNGGYKYLPPDWIAKTRGTAVPDTYNSSRSSYSTERAGYPSDYGRVGPSFTTDNRSTDYSSASLYNNSNPLATFSAATSTMPKAYAGFMADSYGSMNSGGMAAQAAAMYEQNMQVNPGRRDEWIGHGGDYGGRRVEERRERPREGDRRRDSDMRERDRRRSPPRAIRSGREVVERSSSRGLNGRDSRGGRGDDRERREREGGRREERPRERERERERDDRREGRNGSAGGTVSTAHRELEREERELERKMARIQRELADLDSTDRKPRRVLPPAPSRLPTRPPPYIATRLPPRLPSRVLPPPRLPPHPSSSRIPPTRLPPRRPPPPIPSSLRLRRPIITSRPSRISTRSLPSLLDSYVPPPIVNWNPSEVYGRRGMRSVEGWTVSRRRITARMRVKKREEERKRVERRKRMLKNRDKHKEQQDIDSMEIVDVVSEDEEEEDEGAARRTLVAIRQKNALNIVRREAVQKKTIEMLEAKVDDYEEEHDKDKNSENEIELWTTEEVESMQLVLYDEASESLQEEIDRCFLEEHPEEEKKVPAKKVEVAKVVEEASTS